MTRTTPIRVVVVDDHALIRQGVRSLLDSVDDMQLVGEAADGDEAIGLVTELVPDVVLMDLHMPGTDGIAATRSIAAARPDVAVLVVSMLDDDASVFAALRAGARGYVLKGADPDELRRAIIGIAGGEAVFGPGIAQRVLDLLSGSESQVAANPFPELTARELEVLDLLARGETNPAIASVLHVSPRTVANHVSTILSKLHATDRTAAAIRARRAGFGDGV